jgi:hypothetical protein
LTSLDKLRGTKWDGDPRMMDELMDEFECNVKKRVRFFRLVECTYSIKRYKFSNESLEYGIGKFGSGYNNDMANIRNGRLYIPG